VEPFFFGDRAAACFGVYHPAHKPAATRAIVLCHPLGHEYVRAHRAYRNLAQSLSKAGLPVLRFDYFGSGDSAGDSTEAGLEQWNRDVDAAVEEAKRRAGVTRVSLVGLRFGAALATLAAARRDDIVSVLLWDPILSGEAYLQELREVQAHWLRDRLGSQTQRILAGSVELIGMPVDARLLNEIRTVDLRRLDWLKLQRLSIVVSTPREDCEQWQRAVSAKGVPATYCHVPSAGDWVNPESIHQLLLPHDILKEIAARIVAEALPG